VNDGTEEAQAYFDEAGKQLAALDAEMAALTKVGEKLSDIRPGDVFATATPWGIPSPHSAAARP